MSSGGVSSQGERHTFSGMYYVYIINTLHSSKMKKSDLISLNQPNTVHIGESKAASATKSALFAADQQHPGCDTLMTVENW